MATMEMDWILIKKAQQMITFFFKFQDHVLQKKMPKVFSHKVALC